MIGKRRYNIDLRLVMDEIFDRLDEIEKKIQKIDENMAGLWINQQQRNINGV